MKGFGICFVILSFQIDTRPGPLVKRSRDRHEPEIRLFKGSPFWLVEIVRDRLGLIVMAEMTEGGSLSWSSIIELSSLSLSVTVECGESGVCAENYDNLVLAFQKQKLRLPSDLTNRIKLEDSLYISFSKSDSMAEEGLGGGIVA